VAKHLERARKALTLQIYDNARTSSGKATLLGTVAMILGDPSLYKKDLREYEKVSLSDLVRVARTYLQPERLNIVSVETGSSP
jgi:predicted Zn-dependent peptidase